MSGPANTKGAGAPPEARPMRSESTTYRENGNYCEYHQDSGHTTMEYISLEKSIEQLKTPKTTPSLTPTSGPAVIPNSYRTSKVEPDELEVEDIFTISGGQTS